MPDASLFSSLFDKGKEILALNKAIATAVVFWALVLALLAAVDSLRSCGTLYTFAIIGISVGYVASLADAFLEGVQDWAYTKCAAADPWRARCSVPDRYQTLSWLFGKNCTCCGTSEEDPPAEVRSTTTWAFVALFIETAIRAVGNATLYTVYVVGTLSVWTYKEPVQPTPAPTPTMTLMGNETTAVATTAAALVACYLEPGKEVLRWLETDNHALLIVTFVFLAARIVVAVSYPARE